MRTFIPLALITLFVFFSTPAFVFAQTVTSGGGNTQTVTSGGGSDSAGSNVTLINPLKAGTSLETFLGDILKFVVRIGTIVVILMLVYVGYLFVIAQGVPGKIEEARKALLWTVIGALVLLGAQAIASAIEATVKALGG